MAGDAGNIQTSLQTSSTATSGARLDGNTWGGFGGGDWTVNQKGSGVPPWMLLAGLALVFLITSKGKA